MRQGLQKGKKPTSNNIKSQSVLSGNRSSQESWPESAVLNVHAIPKKDIDKENYLKTIESFVKKTLSLETIGSCSPFLQGH